MYFLAFLLAIAPSNTQSPNCTHHKRTLKQVMSLGHADILGLRLYYACVARTLQIKNRVPWCNALGFGVQPRALAGRASPAAVGWERCR